MQQVKKVKGYLRFWTMAECWWRMSLHTAPRETAAAPRSHYNLRRDHKTLVCTHVPPRKYKIKGYLGFSMYFQPTGYTQKWLFYTMVLLKASPNEKWQWLFCEIWAACGKSTDPRTDWQTFGDSFVWWLLLGLVFVKRHGHCSHCHLGDSQK